MRELEATKKASYQSIRALAEDKDRVISELQDKMETLQAEMQAAQKAKADLIASSPPLASLGDEIETLVARKSELETELSRIRCRLAALAVRLCSFSPLATGCPP